MGGTRRIDGGEGSGGYRENRGREGSVGTGRLNRGGEGSGGYRENRGGRGVGVQGD